MNPAEKQDIVEQSLKNETSVVNIKDVLQKYLHFSWLFFLIMALSLLGAWLYLRYTPPKYMISATLLIKNDNNGGGGSQESMFSDMMLLRETSNKQNEIQILKSRTMMVRVINALGLQASYYVVGNVKTTNLYNDAPFKVQFIPPLVDRPFSLQIHFTGPNTFRLGEQTKEHVLGEELTYSNIKIRLVPSKSSYSNFDYKDYIFNWRTETQAALAAMGGLEIKEADNRSNMLQINYTTENPELGADIINTLMQEYNKAAVEDKNVINRQLTSFIDDRLGFVETQLDSVEKDFQRYKATHQVIDLAAQSGLYFDNVNETSGKVREQQLQLQVIELLQNYLQDEAHKSQLVPSTLGLADPTLLELTTAYNTLVTQRLTELQSGATENSPVIKGIDKGLEEARVKLLSNLENIRQANQKMMFSLQSQNKELQQKIAAIPQKERESRERARQQEIKQNLYLFLLQKREESAIAQASTISNSRVIDQALNLASQISPSKQRIYLMAILAGLIIPIGIISVINLLNDKVTIKSDVTRVTQAPILAEVGHNPQDEEGKVLIFPQKSRSIIAEQFRILRSNLQFMLGAKAEKPVIMVTSSFSGEGKSFISTNLGATLAISGKRTVILEFDLRKPKIMSGLNLTKGYGITNYLIGSANLEQLPQQVPQLDNLFVIACGPVPPNPAEILLTKKISELFEWLHEQFDAIIIDTAPIGLVSDSVALSRYADMTLYVIRQRYTFKKQVNFFDEQYRQKKLPKMALLINDVVTKGASSYYGYGGGKYGYGYGYGYGYNSNGSYFENGKSESSKKSTIRRLLRF